MTSCVASSNQQHIFKKLLSDWQCSVRCLTRWPVDKLDRMRRYRSCIGRRCGSCSWSSLSSNCCYRLSMTVFNWVKKSLISDDTVSVWSCSCESALSVVANALSSSLPSPEKEAVIFAMSESLIVETACSMGSKSWRCWSWRLDASRHLSQRIFRQTMQKCDCSDDGCSAHFDPGVGLRALGEDESASLSGTTLCLYDLRDFGCPLAWSVQKWSPQSMQIATATVSSAHSSHSLFCIMAVASPASPDNTSLSGRYCSKGTPANGGGVIAPQPGHPTELLSLVCFSKHSTQIEWRHFNSFPRVLLLSQNTQSDLGMTNFTAESTATVFNFSWSLTIRCSHEHE